MESDIKKNTSEEPTINSEDKSVNKEEIEIESSEKAELKEDKESCSCDKKACDEKIEDDKKEDQKNKEKNHKHKQYDISKDERYIELQKQNALLKDQLLRKQADFENYKKRLNEERIKDRKYALNDFLQESIEVIDIFDKAVNYKTDDEKVKKFLSGFVMVNNRLKTILENNGVKAIDCLNKPFDPSHSSAIETVEVEGVEPNIVVEVVMTGYMYKDRVLRPAMVKVSK